VLNNRSQSYDNYIHTKNAGVVVGYSVFIKEEEQNIFVFEMHEATRGVVVFYSAGVATRDRRIGSSSLILSPQIPGRIEAQCRQKAAKK
jgi:hypothetical protein